jgi:hypothetical protein
MGEDSSSADRQSEAGDRIRTERWTCTGPADLQLSLTAGSIEVVLTDGAGEVSVELAAATDTGFGNWSSGLSGLLNRIGVATGPGGKLRFGGHEMSFGGSGFSLDGLDLADLADLTHLTGGELPASAVGAAEISWSESNRQLTVRSAGQLPARLVPLTVTIHAPARTLVRASTGAGNVTVRGESADADVRTVSGTVEVDRVTGDLRLDAGSGDATVRSVSGRAFSKVGAGDLTLNSLNGPSQLKSGSGDIRVGTARADLHARTGSGDLSVSDAERGNLDLTTGSGDLTVAVHAGVAAQLDLRSGSGRVRSELDVSDNPPSGDHAQLVVHGGTGSGDVLVTRALSSTGAAG